MDCMSSRPINVHSRKAKKKEAKVIGSNSAEVNIATIEK